jgi:hypothetical protein
MACGVDELFEVVVFRRTIEGIYELTQQDAFPKECCFYFICYPRSRLLSFYLDELRSAIISE